MEDSLPVRAAGWTKLFLTGWLHGWQVLSLPRPWHASIAAATHTPQATHSRSKAHAGGRSQSTSTSRATHTLSP